MNAGLDPLQSTASAGEAESDKGLVESVLDVMLAFDDGVADRGTDKLALALAADSAAFLSVAV